MVDVRKIIIIFVIAVLFSVLVFAVIGAIYPEPKYEDFCKNKFYPGTYAPLVKESPIINCRNFTGPTIKEQSQCQDKHGNIEYTYDENNCPASYECNTCQYYYDQTMQHYRLYVFYISAILALIAIFIGLYLPAEKNTLNEWIGTGFMLGGTFALFFGTAVSYTALQRFEKPIVILLELALIIFVAYKKIGNFRKDKGKITKKK